MLLYKKLLLMTFGTTVVYIRSGVSGDWLSETVMLANWVSGARMWGWKKGNRVA